MQNFAYRTEVIFHILSNLAGLWGGRTGAGGPERNFSRERPDSRRAGRSSDREAIRKCVVPRIFGGRAEALRPVSRLDDREARAYAQL